MKISILIPIRNEEENIGIFYHKLKEAISGLRLNCGIIFVNDASADNSAQVLNQIKETDPSVKIINCNDYLGQQKAYLLGFAYCLGDVIVTIDADLQCDPCDIAHFLEKIEAGCDFVSGWRMNRKDPLYRKTISFIANQLITWKTGVRLRDYGCGFNAFKKELIPLFNSRVRDKIYLIKPVLVYLAGSISEIVIHHYPRLRGESKYSLISMARTGLKFLLNPLLRNGGFDVKSKSLVG